MRACRSNLRQKLSLLQLSLGATPAATALRLGLWGRQRQCTRFTSTTPAPKPRRWPDSLVTLAIETSCDDTCVAVLEKERCEGGRGPEEDVPRFREPTHRGGRARLLFEERITADNRAFGGIHPLTAAESHTAVLAPLVQRAVAALPEAPGLSSSSAGTSGGRPDFVSATRGPGMAASLAVGLSVAKGLAVAWGVPLVGVHHMQAHALTPRLVSAMESRPDPSSLGPCLPYLSLLVSGGHTLLVHSQTLTDHRVVAAAANIAVGDLLDKCARAILPAGYIAEAEAAAGRSLPYGRLLETFAFPEAEEAGAAEEKDKQQDYLGYTYPARRRDEMMPFESDEGWRIEAPLGMDVLRKVLRYDFSGLNGSVQKLAMATNSASSTSSASLHDRRLLARATMQLAFEHIASRLLLALEGGGRRDETAGSGAMPPLPPPTCLVVSGGVASNGFLRHVLRSALDVRGFGHVPLVAPPPALCTDNAAMIAWAGMEMYEAGWQTDLDVLPLRRWPMDGAEEGGILGAPGWKRQE